MNPTGLTLNFFSRMFSSKGAHSLIKQDSDDEDKDPDENTSMLESLNETNSDQRSSGTPNSVKKQHRTHEISSKSKSESLLMQRSTSEEDLDLEIVKLASKKRGSNSKGWFAPTGNRLLKTTCI